MTELFLDASYWQNDFAVTDGDLNRLAGVLREAGEPQAHGRIDIIGHLSPARAQADRGRTDSKRRQLMNETTPRGPHRPANAGGRKTSRIVGHSRVSPLLRDKSFKLLQRAAAFERFVEDVPRFRP